MKAFLSIGIIFILVGICTAKLQYAGVNQAGAEFGGVLPGVENTNYKWPAPSSIDHFVSKGMNIFRVPFLWERLQPTLNGTFEPAYLRRLHDVISYITQNKSAYAIIDPHNYLLYRGKPVGDASVPPVALRNFWRVLAAEFVNNSRVIFGLMNEPAISGNENVLIAMQQALYGVRDAGATQLILVPGNCYTGAYSWTAKWCGNSLVMGNITDPLNHYAFEMHQYFDQDYGGKVPECRADWNTKTMFDATTAWLRERGAKAFLGEFGIANNDHCMTIGESVLQYLEDNDDVWFGWTYWAAGPAWPEDEMFAIEPTGGVDKNQTLVLYKHLDLEVPTSSSSNVESTTNTVSASISISSSTSSSHSNIDVSDDDENNSSTASFIQCNSLTAMNLILLFVCNIFYNTI